jgi:hypothetical protein
MRFGLGKARAAESAQPQGTDHRGTDCNCLEAHYELLVRPFALPSRQLEQLDFLFMCASPPAGWTAGRRIASAQQLLDTQ